MFVHVVVVSRRALEHIAQHLLLLGQQEQVSARQVAHVPLLARRDRLVVGLDGDVGRALVLARRGFLVRHVREDAVHE